MVDVLDELLGGKRPEPTKASPPSPVVDELLSGGRLEEPAAEAKPAQRGLLERGARFLGDWNLSAAQGATFGYSDEAAAWIGEKFGFGDYDELLKGIRERHEEIPSSIAIPGELAGGVGMAAATAPLGGVGAGTKIGAAAAKLPGWLKAAGLGGLFGGLYGSGTAEEGERLESGLYGAVLGTLGAGVLHPVGSLIKKGVSSAGAQIRSRVSPEKEALAQIRQAFARDEMTPAKLRARLRELGPQATLADAAGKNTQRLVGAAAGTPGRAQNRVEQILTQRAEGEGERIVRAINRGVSLDDFYAAEEAFLNNLRTKADPLYEQAYKAHQSIMTPNLKRIIRSKTGRKAMREAADLLEIERGAGQASYLGAVDDELTAALRSAREVGKTPGIGKIQPGVSEGFSLRTWDMIKRGLDSLMDNKAYRNELTGRLNERGRAVAMLKKTLTRELDKATGGKQSTYAQARKIYSGDAEVLDALREGREALTKDPEIITRELSELSDAAREAYRAGAARALRDVVEKTSDTASAANRLFGTTLKRKQLRALFPDQEDFNRLRRTLVGEQRFAKTRNVVLGGSPTREKLEAGRDIVQRAAGAAAIMGGGGGEIMLAAMRRRAAEALFGPRNEQFLSRVTQMLVNRNPAMNQRAIDLVFSKMGMAQAPQQVKRETASWLVPMIVGQRSGEAISPRIQSGQ